MPLARHDINRSDLYYLDMVSTHMPLARHDQILVVVCDRRHVSTHMPLARHDEKGTEIYVELISFYSHASCEA